MIKYFVSQIIDTTLKLLHNINNIYLQNTQKINITLGNSRFYAFHFTPLL